MANIRQNTGKHLWQTGKQQWQTAMAKQQKSNNKAIIIVAIGVTTLNR